MMLYLLDMGPCYPIHFPNGMYLSILWIGEVAEVGKLQTNKSSYKKGCCSDERNNISFSLSFNLSFVSAFWCCERRHVGNNSQKKPLWCYSVED